MEKETAFTEEQVRELAENRYTYRVSRKSITFTPEFMRLLCGKKAEGMSNRKIFEDCGYDPDVLGRYRMSNAVRKTKGKRPEDFPDKPLPKSKMRDFDENSDKRAMKQMQLEMKRMHQEIEFLKKIMATGVIESGDD